MQSQLYMDLAPPVHGQVITIANSATAARYEVPPSWKNQMVTFVNTDSTMYVAFGDANVKIETAEVAIVLGETITPNWASGVPIPAGMSVSVPVPAYCTHFSVDTAVATGVWSAYVSSGEPRFGEHLGIERIGKPLLWLDAARRETVTCDSGAVTVSTWRCRQNGYVFAEATNKPDLLDAAGAGTALVRPAVSFVAGSSEKLVASDATLAAALGSTNAFTLLIACRRAATGVLHTVFSVGTGGSNNGRWDFTLNTTDDPIVTRVTAAGASTTSTYATTINGMNVHVVTFDGSTPLYYLDRTAQTLTGTAAGDVGTTTKVAVGCRAYNTSTFDQFASVELTDLIVWDKVLSDEDRVEVFAWAKRRYGK